MYAINSPVFLLTVDGAGEQILVPGKVVESDAEKLVARFEEAISPGVGIHVEVYAEKKRKFTKQGAKVVAVLEPVATPLIEFQPQGEPALAERRQTYRVSTLSLDIFARVGEHNDCHIADLSAEGLSAITKNEMQTATMVEVEFAYEGQVLKAKAMVRTVKPLAGGAFRHGLLVPENARSARQALQQMSVLAQRAQLRRMSGAL